MSRSGRCQRVCPLIFEVDMVEQRLARMWVLLSASAAAAAVGCGSDGGGPVAGHVLASGEIGTWAGDGMQGNNGDGHHRTETWLDQPMEMAFADDGTAIVVDWNNHCVRRVTRKGTFENIIGTDFPGDWPCQIP